ncbi:ABC transporter ATP-binding protein [Lactococcus lactis]|uniref:ABC transporter ATP-binding protein n=1 Tax=Lactococcus lactis TaxID=1358 RepID=UPI00288E99D9|nr:ABC transporter ATP-binding protein [Lactococcus lactis]MDT2893993.1 ABC transporter ATP-binding protein [Lactococcus lactis]MDT2904575.1 ABC transporter ATP-binding protein [Lactococcus lactis]MDT2910350.1 ABC transporter ATP-binding protein [Lactococcus lactis]MDT2931904.1 ABC transporter ATP-binding protein [Lactococcus lactis]MDT2937299.1 ABC transporter ATP-binding protein [Lactococcus lactis]
MDKLVEVKGLQKNFGQFQALKDVSFEVNAGEVLGYIGPNGAGKSTTIRILLGIIRATQGKVQIFGKDVWQDSIEIHKKIAYVPGDVYLWPNLSGGETIDLFLKLHGAINQEKRDQLIKKFDLNPKKKVRSYSKGNRQKIALIAALATEAELYIFDEPTSGLDPLMEAVFQEEVKELKELKAAGKAIILSSHILSEVEKLADRVAVIRKGEIVETGTLDDLRHLTRYQYKVEMEQEAVGLKELSSVHDLQIKENEATFQADSDAIDEILKTLLLYGVKKLEATPPTLEDLFMRHYQ